MWQSFVFDFDQFECFICDRSVGGGDCGDCMIVVKGFVLGYEIFVKIFEIYLSFFVINRCCFQFREVGVGYYCVYVFESFSFIGIDFFDVGVRMGVV